MYLFEHYSREHVNGESKESLNLARISIFAPSCRVGSGKEGDS